MEEYVPGKDRPSAEKALAKHLDRLVKLKGTVAQELNGNDKVTAYRRMESLCSQIARVAERLQDKEAELEAYREEARYADESIPVFINLDLLNQDQLLTRMGSVAETYRKGGNKTRAQELINKVLKYRPQDEFALEVQRKLDEE